MNHKALEQRSQAPTVAVYTFLCLVRSNTDIVGSTTRLQTTQPKVNSTLLHSSLRVILYRIRSKRQFRQKAPAALSGIPQLRKRLGSRQPISLFPRFASLRPLEQHKFQTLLWECFRSCSRPQPMIVIEDSSNLASVEIRSASCDSKSVWK